LPIQASESGATLSYSAVGLPDGLSINSSTGLIAGTVAAGAALGGPYAVTVTASDGVSSNSATFNWSVAPAQAPAAVVQSNPGSQSSLTGDSVAVQVQATNPGGYALTYSATGLPDGLSIDPFSGLISGTLADDAASSTPYSVTVTVDNGVGGVVRQTFAWSVQPSPIQAQGVAVSAAEGNDTGNVAVAQFTTADLNSQASDFTAMVYWGDGSSDQGTVMGGNGSFTVLDDHAYAAKGNYPLYVLISGSDGVSATAYAQVTVVDAGLNLTGGFDLGTVKWQSSQLTLGTLTDGNPEGQSSDLSATVNWGDGSGNQSLMLMGANGIYPLNGNHSYSQDGTYVATLTVTDVDGATASTTSTVTVGDAYAGEAYQLYLGGASDGNSSAPLSDYVATVYWGDGTSSPGTVLGSAGALSLQATHTYASDSLDQPGGVYQVSVTINDDDGSTLSGSTNVEVVRPPLQLYMANVASSGTDFNNVELASFTDPDASDAAGEFQVQIDWGDGTPLDTSGQVVGTNGQFHIVGSHTYGTIDDYPVTVTLLQGWSAYAAVMEGQAGSDAGAKEPSLYAFAPPGDTAAVRVPGTNIIQVPGSSSMNFVLWTPNIKDPIDAVQSITVAHGQTTENLKPKEVAKPGTPAAPGQARFMYFPVSFPNIAARYTITATLNDKAKTTVSTTVSVLDWGVGPSTGEALERPANPPPGRVTPFSTGTPWDNREILPLQKTSQGIVVRYIGQDLWKGLIGDYDKYNLATYQFKLLPSGGQPLGGKMYAPPGLSWRAKVNLHTTSPSLSQVRVGFLQKVTVNQYQAHYSSTVSSGRG
jgi:hypothetical protein